MMRLFCCCQALPRVGPETMEGGEPRDKTDVSHVEGLKETTQRNKYP